MATTLREEGDLGPAETILHRALTVRELRPGANLPEVASPLDVLGLVIYRQKRPAESEPLYKRSLAI